ncbi:hypothetical protein ABIA85_003453 [Bradyrhizobium sp. LA6.10]|uniref:hypothetical protein n=1 Tax=Bradyrhizobium sp. LA6.10 TaxID=3156318 RepID=UPI00339A284D
MSDETPDFIERTASIAKNWTGEEWGPDKIIEEFQLYGHSRRSTTLDDMDQQLREMKPSNLRRYAQLNALRRDLDRVHHALRKAGR